VWERAAAAGRHPWCIAGPGRPGRPADAVLRLRAAACLARAAPIRVRPGIEHAREASPGRRQFWRGRARRQGSEAQMKLVELKDKTALSREEAAARLHGIAGDALSGNDVVIEPDDIRIVAHVPDQVNLKVEFEIELTW